MDMPISHILYGLVLVKAGHNVSVPHTDWPRYYMHSWDDTKSAFPSEWEFRPRPPGVVL